MPHNRIIDHSRFLALGARLKARAEGKTRIVVNIDDADVILEHHGWFADYIEKQKAAGKTGGRPRKAESQKAGGG